MRIEKWMIIYSSARYYHTQFAKDIEDREKYLSIITRTLLLYAKSHKLVRKSISLSFIWTP